MKKIILIGLIILFQISCKFNKNEVLANKTFKITGTVENLKDSLSIILSRIDSRNFYGKKIDSTISKNGSFELQVNTVDPSEYLIMIIDYKNHIGKRLNLWLENKNITINGNYDNFAKSNIHGSELSRISIAFNDIGEKFTNKMKNGEIDYAEYQQEKRKECIDFLFQNSNNLVSLNQILEYRDILTKDSLQLYYNKLDDNLKNSKNGIALKNIFEIEKIKIGEQFIDIEAKDLDGNNVKLSDFKGKVIVLDFWAYWCHYCHEQNQEEFPKLKEKYKNEDFIIVSYSVDVDKKDWEKSSKADNIDWVNISNLAGKSDKVAIQYGVKGYPTSFIIGKDGKVLKKMNGYIYDALENELDKIFEIK